MKNYPVILFLLSALVLSCQNSEVGYNQTSESDVAYEIESDSVIDNAVIVPKAEWETEDFLTNSDAYEKNLSEKAKKGDAEAIKDLGMHFLMPYKSSSKLKQDEDLGVALLMKSSNLGSAEAQCFLAGVYSGHYGSGKYNDLSEARKWLEMSAKNGYAKAEFRVGYNYSYGVDGFPQDYSEALKWRKAFAVKGASIDHIEAQFNVGWHYWYGKGVEVDKTEAMKWFRMAADNGDAEAKKIVEKYGDLY